MDTKLDINKLSITNELQHISIKPNTNSNLNSYHSISLSGLMYVHGTAFRDNNNSISRFISLTWGEQKNQNIEPRVSVILDINPFQSLLIFSLSKRLLSR